MFSNVIAGRYQVLEQVGEGGAAQVYQAMDTRLGRVVALKLLREQHADAPSFTQRFRNEARAAARLSHPNIVDVYDYDRWEGRYFIAMEYVPGPNLKEWMFQRALEHGLPSEAESRELIAQVLEGLGAAHAAGVIHRDMKPQNVLVSPDGRLKIADFGIAKAVGQAAVTAANTAFGTPHYLSPEQARGEPASVRSDLYAVGVMLYELLSGRLPFEDDNPLRVAYAHGFEQPPPIREVAPHASPGIAVVVERAMAKDPGERYAGAAEMLHALRSAGASRPAGASPSDATVAFPAAARAAPAPVGAPARAVPRAEGREAARRPSALWIAAPLLLLLLVVGAAVASRGGGGGEQAAALPGETATPPPSARLNGSRPKETPAVDAPGDTPTPQVSAALPPAPTSAPTRQTSPAVRPPRPATRAMRTATPTPEAAPTPTLPKAAAATASFDDDVCAVPFPAHNRNYKGRTAQYIYSQLSRFNTMRCSFTLPGELARERRRVARVRVYGMDSEDDAKTAIRIALNGAPIFVGDNTLPDDNPGSDTPGNWGDETFPFPASLLRPGRNELTVVNLEQTGGRGRPPWFMLDYAVVTYYVP